MCDIRYVWYIFISIVIVFVTGCDFKASGMKRQVQTANVPYKNLNVQLQYEYSGFNKKPPYPLKNILDTNNAKKWQFYGSTLNIEDDIPGCTGGIFFAFDKYVKLKYITINQDPGNKKKIKKLAVVVYHKADFRTISYYGNWSEYELDNKSKQTVDIRNKVYMPDLYIKSFLLISQDCFGADINTPVTIDDIELEFTNEKLFVPDMDVEEIRAIRNDKKLVTIVLDKYWEIKDSVKNKDELIDKINRNLIYYGLNGDVEAEKLFFSHTSEYKKVEGIYGRGPTGLKEWYKSSVRVLENQDQNTKPSKKPG